MHDVLLRMVTGCAIFLAGLLAGARSRVLQVHAADETVQPLLRLHRFSLKPDQLQTFERWVEFEHAHHAETVSTLGREHMYVEAIFRDKERDPATIYWLEVRGQHGAPVATSALPIDKVYEEFMRRTLLPGSRRTLLPEYTLIPAPVLHAMQEGDGAVPLTGAGHP